MTNLRTKITRTSPAGFRVRYDSWLSQSAQISIDWDNGLGGGVGMSIENAKKLQGLLSEVLSLINPPQQLTFKVKGLQWPATLGDFALMGPINSRGAWRWYRRNVIIDGRLVAERVKVDSNLRPIWESLIRE